MIVALHCGHSIFGASLFALRDDGASKSATQSRRQDSCAVSAQGHGDLHIEDVGVSSVSSAKHIQHFRGSLSSDSAERSRGCSCTFSEGGVEPGVLRSNVCESIEAADAKRGSLRSLEGELVSCEES